MGTKWTILSPVAPKPTSRVVAGEQAPHREIRPLADVRFGFQVDYAWNCYSILIDEWEKLAAAGGAKPNTLWIERSRNQKTARSKDEIRNDIDDWSRLVDVGVVGLGN